MTSISSGIVSSIPSLGNSAAASAATQSMAELGVAGLIGAGCVERDLLNPPMIKALSGAVFKILLPMLLTSSIISSVTKYGLSKSSMVVPLLAISQSSFLYIITTQFTLPLFGVDKDSIDGRGATVCCSFGNSGVIPLIFCESLFRRSKNPDDVALATSFVSLFLVGWSPFFWAFGRDILLPKDKVDDIQVDKKAEIIALVKRALPPPVCGVLIGLVVATTPLCKLFVSSNTSDGIKKAPLAVVFNSIANFGGAASPLSLLILVSSLAVGANIGNYNNEIEKEEQEESDIIGPLAKLALVSITRFVLSPCLMYGLLSLASKIGAINDHTENPMLWFILILEASMPPAQNSVIMYQVANKGQKAGEMAKFLFQVYATGMMPIVIILTLALKKFGFA